MKQPGVLKKSGDFEFQPAQNSTTHWEIFIATTGERAPPHFRGVTMAEQNPICVLHDGSTGNGGVSVVLQ